MMTKRKKVLLGMSGGVDSSVSAVLLLEQGYEVVGAFMKNWSSCDWRAERRDAMRVAAQLGIEFHTLDFEAAYREKVIKNVFKEYAAGRTPNPDVLCNKYVKFDLFVDAADKLGCEFVATGHYASVKNGDDDTSSYWCRRHHSSCLIIPKDTNKDQTYFLSAMPREVLPRVIFPLADLTKPEVRGIARTHCLSVAEKKDSVGICFVGEVNIVEFLKQEIPPNPGPVVTTDGRVVGEHEGVAFFTIGQRHGIGTIGGGPPYYVVRKEMETNTLVVGTEVDPALFSKELTAKDVNWLVEITTPNPSFKRRGIASWRMRFHPSLWRRGRGWWLGDEANCLARIRYRQALQKARVEVLDSGKIHVVFDEPQRAVTPGQSVVLYSEDGVVLGGAIIE